ncbi:AAA family ATPase [Pseudomonas alliivorans]|nr:AAA family ATPase [Pseudomonas alliivorans]
MSGKQKIHVFANIGKLVTRLRDDLTGGNQDFVLIYAYNGTGKTRLSMEFKDAGKRKNKGFPDTLYFNAFTEDLFSWDNDLDKDSERLLRLNADSKFFDGLKDLALEVSIGDYLGRYADFLFDIDYDRWTISFRKNEVNNIKVSRGEENIFIWCLFMAICERVIDGAESYAWVKYLYVDDPISSLDDNNAIAVASDLAKLLRRGRERWKVVLSSHHALFFNVLCNELKKAPHKKYFLHRPDSGATYTLRATDDTPFFHHVATLAEIHKAAADGKLYTYHFNMLRSIMEKTATFFGYDDFSACIHGVEDEVLYSRALNLLSHGKYAIYQPMDMVDDTKDLFRQILSAFLNRYRFALPDILEQPTTMPAPIPTIEPPR